jgi:hypothetical protein
MPYRKNKQTNRYEHSRNQPRTLYCIAHRQPVEAQHLFFGAEGASASMADRAVRAARLYLASNGKFT